MRPITALCNLTHNTTTKNPNHNNDPAGIYNSIYQVESDPDWKERKCSSSMYWNIQVITWALSMNCSYKDRKLKCLHAALSVTNCADVCISLPQRLSSSSDGHVFVFFSLRSWRFEWLNTVLPGEDKSSPVSSACWQCLIIPASSLVLVNQGLEKPLIRETQRLWP